jgi:hypothetical protein
MVLSNESRQVEAEDEVEVDVVWRLRESRISSQRGIYAPPRLLDKVGKHSQ